MHKANKIKTKYIADAIAIAHALWLALVVTSLPISFKWKKYKYVGLVGILATLASWEVWGDCPLFVLENRLRKQYDPKEAYTGSFSSHYLHKYFSIDIPTKIFTAAGYSYAALIAGLAVLDQRKVIINAAGRG